MLAGDGHRRVAVAIMEVLVVAVVVVVVVAAAALVLLALLSKALYYCFAFHSKWEDPIDYLVSPGETNYRPLAKTTKTTPWLVVTAEQNELASTRTQIFLQCCNPTEEVFAVPEPQTLLYSLRLVLSPNQL